MKLWRAFVRPVLPAVALACMCYGRLPAQVPLIPREILFGIPDRIGPQLSPRGSLVAYVAPDSGVPNVWVQTPGKEDARDITQDHDRGIAVFQWAPDGQAVLAQHYRAEAGNEHVWSFPVSGGPGTDLTPWPKLRAVLLAAEPAHPGEILVGLYEHDPLYADVYRVDLKTATHTLEMANEIKAVRWYADRDLRLRLAQVAGADGGMILKLRGESGWSDLLTWDPAEETVQVLPRFGADQNSIFVLSNQGSTTTELRRLDLRTGKMKVLASDAGADVAFLTQDPKTQQVQAVDYNKARHAWVPLDGSIRADLDAVGKICGGDFLIPGRDQADDAWLIAANPDPGPVEYYLYHRGSRKAVRLFSSLPRLGGYTLARMAPVEFPARDGLVLNGYLTLPAGGTGKNLPAVLVVRDSPWSRDSGEFNPEIQWLANRGYACLQVNFRGSSGYGKQFARAGDKEWGGKMQDDLSDAAAWLAAQGIADPRKIGIFGRSYGGYAALRGLTSTPKLFACGVSQSGPASLVSFLKALPPGLQPLFHRRVGDPEADSKMLFDRSPLFAADQVRAPLFIATGANDNLVRTSEIYQFRDLLQSAGRKVSYMEFPDEGHGLTRQANRLKFYGAVEKFLAAQLGGRAEPDAQ